GPVMGAGASGMVTGAPGVGWGAPVKGTGGPGKGTCRSARVPRACPAARASAGGGSDARGCPPARGRDARRFPGVR
ncbi:MAG: hypothetical protein LBF09_03335, partial [Odoribacteraceae bacterium]|nr:hypothetical protein [Odoribacteraceae bacterium]